jgi:hypothetical protein
MEHVHHTALHTLLPVLTISCYRMFKNQNKHYTTTTDFLPKLSIRESFHRTPLKHHCKFKLLSLFGVFKINMTHCVGEMPALFGSLVTLGALGKQTHAPSSSCASYIIQTVPWFWLFKNRNKVHVLMWKLALKLEQTLESCLQKEH